MNIEICMGSSCFLRGNREALRDIQAYVAAEASDASVTLRGILCHKACQDGPIIIVDGATYRNVAPGQAVPLLRKLRRGASV